MKRYDFETMFGEDEPRMWEKEDGDYVLHADAQAAIREAERRGAERMKAECLSAVENATGAPRTPNEKRLLDEAWDAIRALPLPEPAE